MTLSILTFDSRTGTFAAAAATGSLCVGGWVLRGDIESGLVASQGTAPSTFWRDDVLRQMYQGRSAEAAINDVTQDDTGRCHRQITALDRTGAAYGFTGSKSVAFSGHHTEDGLAIAGNMLSGPAVIDAMKHAADQAYDGPAARMLNILSAARDVGGDSRGLLSAAMLILAPDRAPLDLRIDHHEDPIGALDRLCAAAHQLPYYEWLKEVPVFADKSRAPA